MRLRNRLKYLAKYGQQEGWMVLLREILRKLKGMIYVRRSAVLLQRDLRAPVPALEARVPLHLRLLRAADAPRLAEVAYYPETEILKRLDAGQLCVIGTVDSRIVHYSWLNPGKDYFSEIEFPIAPGLDEMYLYNCRTAVDMRGQRVYPAAIVFLLDQAAKRGMTNVVTMVVKRNEASIKALQRSGFVKCREITFRKFLGWRAHVTREAATHG